MRLMLSVAALVAALAVFPACAEMTDVVPQQPSAYQEMQQKAEGGDPAAQYDLGNAFYAGDPGKDIVQDLSAAAGWFRKAADGGHAEAQYRLGVIHANGQGVVQDYTAAHGWFRRAAAQGHARAQYELASLLLRGLGGTEDYTEAYLWLLLAAKGGVADAKAMLPKVEASLAPVDIEAMQGMAETWKPGGQP